MDLLEIDDTWHLQSRGGCSSAPYPCRARARNNTVEFHRAGRRITVRVPDEVDLKIEFELGDEESELEIGLTW